MGVKSAENSIIMNTFESLLFCAVLVAYILISELVKKMKISFLHSSTIAVFFGVALAFANFWVRDFAIWGIWGEQMVAKSWIL